MRVLVACRHGADRTSCDRCAARRAYMAGWRARNPEKVKSYSTKYVRNNPEARRATEKSWRARNPEAVKAYSSKAGKKWAAKNKAKRLVTVRARQLAKHQRTPAWADKKAIAAVYEHAARVTRETGIPHEVDHIVPLQGDLISGLHVHQNLQVITRSENRSKQNRWAQ